MHRTPDYKQVVQEFLEYYEKNRVVIQEYLSKRSEVVERVNELWWHGVFPRICNVGIVDSNTIVVETYDGYAVAMDPELLNNEVEFRQYVADSLQIDLPPGGST